MEAEGHHVTGMTNQIVWGIPHVFAVFLIVTASGALNVASLSSVMGQKIYAPYARLSALLAIALLLGGARHHHAGSGPPRSTHGRAHPLQ